MSKSSNNGISTDYMDKLVENYADLGMEIRELSSVLSQNATILKESTSAFKKFEASKKTEKDALTLAKNLIKTRYDVGKIDLGVETTKISNLAAEKFAQKLAPILQKTLASPNGKNYSSRAMTIIDNFYTSGVFQSMRDEQRGAKSNQLFFRNTLDNEKLSRMYNDFANKMGVKIDNFQYKLLTFFKGAGQSFKKTVVGLGKDLLDGLEKSKWVGGALRDTFRLVGLLGAQWMSRFGQLGRIMGGAFYVAMELAGPAMVNLLLRGLGKLLPLILGGMGRVGGALGWGNLAGLAIGGAGAVMAYNAARDSERKGLGENANAYRVGGTVMGAGALSFGGAAVASGVGVVASGLGASGVATTAAGIAGALGPIGIALVAIGGVVAGIAHLYKRHYEKEMEHFYGTKEYYEKVLSDMAELTDEQKAMTGLQGTMAGPGSAGYASSDQGEYVTYGKMKVSKRDKSILNLHELSQKEASAAIQAYEAADPEGFNSLYEWVDSKHADLASFETDAVKFDHNGNKIAALGKKGQSREIDEFRKYLTKYLRGQGYEYGEASRIAGTYMMSSGKATGSNKYHTPGSEGSRYKTHFDQYGRTIDIIGEGMNTFGGKALAAFYSTGTRGYKVNVEQEGEGKSTGVHAHINPAKNVMSMAAQLNAEKYDKAMEKQRAIAAQNTIGVGNILKEVDKKAYEYVTSGTPVLTEQGRKNREEVYARELKKRGITLDTVDSTDVQAYSRMNNGQKEFAFMDDSGNVTWMIQKHAILYLQQYGANY